MFWISFKFCSSYSIECSHYFAILACCWAISSTEISTKRQKWGAEWQQRRIRCQNCTYILYKTKTILINWEQEWHRNLEIEEMYHCFANILTWSFFIIYRKLTEATDLNFCSNRRSCLLILCTPVVEGREVGKHQQVL